MFQLIQNYKEYKDYIPIMLITLLFIAENEVEKHAINTCCQIAITIITVTVFFLFLIQLRRPKLFAFTIAFFFWVFLVYIKKRYLI